MKQRQTVIETREELFIDLVPGQRFYSIKEGNGEIDQEFRKVDQGFAKIIGIPLLHSELIPIPLDFIVLVDVH